MPYRENLTETESKARMAWGEVLRIIEKVGREDILENPNVLDLGGGAGEFSKYLNQHGVKSASLDIKDLITNPGAHQVRGDVHSMPFLDGAFNIVHVHGAFDVYEYKHDFDVLLSEVERVLRPKGILVIREFFHPKWQEFEKRFKQLVGFPDVNYMTVWERK